MINGNPSIHFPLDLGGKSLGVEEFEFDIEMATSESPAKSISRPREQKKRNKKREKQTCLCFGAEVIGDEITRRAQVDALHMCVDLRVAEKQPNPVGGGGGHGLAVGKIHPHLPTLNGSAM